jgi:hypothetical protein
MEQKTLCALPISPLFLNSRVSLLLIRFHILSNKRNSKFYLIFFKTKIICVFGYFKEYLNKSNFICAIADYKLRERTQLREKVT